MNRHPETSPPGTAPVVGGSRDRSARRLSAWLAVPVAVVLLLSGCTGGPGDREDLVDVLTRNDNFEPNEANCIADAIFDRYGDDGDALGKISGAESYEFLTGEDGVEGFGDFLTATVTDCTAVGPSPSDG